MGVDPRPRIGLALSGGGVRAIAFHAGVLKWMAEEGLLESVDHISSVSGGSLFTGLVFCLSENKWPTSKDYSSRVLPRIGEILTKYSLQWDLLRRLLFYPSNWQYTLSRAKVLSQSIRDLWGISACMSELPQEPVWTINGSTAETGRRFRFKGATAGDYKLGYATVQDYPVANAMAMSAAFPIGIGPLPFSPKGFKWKKRKHWNDSECVEIPPPTKKLHLYDGGVYDNLGMEPLYDCGRQRIKKHNSDRKISNLIISDAGAKYNHKKIPHPLNPFRAKVIMDLMQEQGRALRVRSFVNFMQNCVENSFSPSGMYLQIGSSPKDKIRLFVSDGEKRESMLASYEWLTQEFVNKAASVPTSLKKMKVDIFNLLVEHGYQSALWNKLIWF